MPDTRGDNPDLPSSGVRLTVLNKHETSASSPKYWGPLKVIEHLDSGVSSEVYRARHTVLDRDVALKLFHSRDEVEQQRLLEEGHALVRVRHPNILQVLGADRHDGQVGFWMELAEGPSLAEILEQQGPVNLESVIEIGRHLCAALATIHNAGLLYRDIKLENVKRVKDSGIRLMGFGPDIDRTEVAPELLEGGRPSRQSDIYALGALLQRLAGRAIESPDDKDFVAQQMDSCLKQATAQDPRERFAKAEEFAKALTRAGKRPPSRIRRILGVTLILILAALVIMQWPSQYRFDNTLYRINPDQSRTELVDGADIGSGDQLALEVTTTVSMYVYVFGEDERGDAYGLFPQADAGHANPLRSDETHTLPAEGVDALNWVIGDATQIARIHVLAFPEEVPEFEALYHELPPLGSVDPLRTAAAPLIEAARILDEDAEFAIGVTYRVIELNRPQD
jgi:hypothetical protein